MLATVKSILSYLNWLALIAFIIIFGLYLIPKLLIVSVLVFLFALGMLLIMLKETSRKYSPENRVSAGKPLGNPLVDISCGVYAYYSISSSTDLRLLYIVGIIMVCIDLSVWAIGNFDRFFNKH